MSAVAAPAIMTATTTAKASWVMLFPAGKYKTERHGTLTFDPATLAEIKESFDKRVRGIDIAVDVDHRAPNANDTKAAGWLKRVEFGTAIGREPGLWGEVEWTPYGLSEVQSRQYRYISSEYQPGTWKNEITGVTAKNVLFGLTLTNRPVMKNMPAIQLGAQGNTRKGGRNSYSVSESADAQSTDGADVGRVEVYMGLAQQIDDDEQTELAELDDSDTEEYADSEDAADGGDDETEEGEPPIKAKKSAKKMSEARTLAEANTMLIEYQQRLKALERKDYENGVSKILGGWEAGTQQFSEQRGAAKTKPNGEAAKPVAGGRPVKVALSRPAMQAARKLMLSESFAELDEDLRGEIAKVIELAATGAVDLSVRGGNNDTERTKTTKLSVVKPQGDAAAFDEAWQANSVALAEAAGDDYAALVKLSAKPTMLGRQAAEKVEQYQAKAYTQTLAGE